MINCTYSLFSFFLCQIYSIYCAALNDSSEPSTATSIFFENPAEVVDKLCEFYRY